MWTCPKCNTAFVQRNLTHSCGRFSVDGFLKGKSDHAVRLFWFFINEWKNFGEVKLHPVKTSVSILDQVRFARVNRIKRGSIVGHLWLKQECPSDKFFRIEKLGASDFVHHFEMADESSIDDEFRGFMSLAYDVGQRKHIRARE